MASIGNLAVTLTANTASFVRNLGKASVGVKSFERSASSVTGTLKKLAAGLAAVAGAAGTVALIKNSFKLIDAQAKTADKLGLTTEALAGLRLAASRSGVATSALDTGLQRMTRRVAEAAKGTGEARNAIAELGLDAKKLVAQSPDEQFKQIAEAMNRVDRQTDRVRLSFKLFDTEGVALVNTLASGRSGLDAAEAAARRFGTAVSRIDAAKIEIANDAIADLKDATVGLFNSIAIEIAPLVAVLAKKFEDLGVTFRDKVGRVIAKTMDAIADGLNQLSIETSILTLKQIQLGAEATIINFAQTVVDTSKDAINEIALLYGQLTGEPVPLFEKGPISLLQKTIQSLEDDIAKLEKQKLESRGVSFLEIFEGLFAEGNKEAERIENESKKKRKEEEKAVPRKLPFRAPRAEAGVALTELFMQFIRVITPILKRPDLPFQATQLAGGAFSTSAEAIDRVNLAQFNARLLKQTTEEKSLDEQKKQTNFLQRISDGIESGVGFTLEVLGI